MPDRHTPVLSTPSLPDTMDSASKTPAPGFRQKLLIAAVLTALALLLFGVTLLQQRADETARQIAGYTGATSVPRGGSLPFMVTVPTAVGAPCVNVAPPVAPAP